MDRLYQKVERAYYRVRKEIIKMNALGLKDAACHRPMPRRPLHTVRSQAIIPFISPDPKARFLIIAAQNVFTANDPVLRFLPDIPDAKKASISWYDETVIGEKPIKARDTINELFIAHPEGEEDEKIEYLLNDGRLNTPRARKQTMDELFCPVCLIFCCGIHEMPTHDILHFSERNVCRCNSRVSAFKVEKKEMAKGEDWKQLAINANFLLLTRKDGNLNATVEPSLKIDVNSYKKLKPCIRRQICQHLNLPVPPCTRLPSTSIPVKKIVARSNRPIAPDNFYKPCNCKNSCSDSSCGCVKNGVACELVCSCLKCHNYVFCSCLKCDGDCPCAAVSRDCTEKCKCYLASSGVVSLSNFLQKKDLKYPRNVLEPAPKQAPLVCNIYSQLFRKMDFLLVERIGALNCGNQNVRFKKTISANVFRSDKHGYGLFSNCYIPKDTFVTEYTGEIISDKETERRGNFYEINKCSYLFNLSSQNEDCLYSVDAFYIGNISRYINHSRLNANLRSDVYVSGGIQHIIFCSIKDIFQGEELFFDYQFSEEHMKGHGIVE